MKSNWREAIDPESARLLDGAEYPSSARRAHECPEFRGLRTLGRIALDHAAGRVHRHVGHGELHRDRRVFAVGFSPGLGKVALVKMHVGDDVADAAAGLLAKLLGEVA